LPEALARVVDNVTIASSAAAATDGLAFPPFNDRRSQAGAGDAGITHTSPECTTGHHANQAILPLIAGGRTGGAVWPDAEDIDWCDGCKPRSDGEGE